MKIKIRMTILFILIMPAMVLTACGSGTEDIADTTKTAEEGASASEIPMETITAPETYEDYMKLAEESYDRQDWESAIAFYQGAKELDVSREEVYRGMSDTYLQMDNVIQALAVLDEGIEKLGAREQDVEKQKVDLISQRKEYILAGTVAVATGGTSNQYDEDGSILLESEWEGDENGNKISEKTINYDNRRGSSYLSEYQYDRNGNKIEFKYTYYDSDGNGSLSSHVTWTFDKDGNEIEWTADDKYTNSKKRTERGYDANGKQIKEINYDNDELTGWIESEYDVFGNKIRYEEYDKDRKCTYKTISSYNEQENLNYFTVYDYGKISKTYEYEYDEKGNMIKSAEYDGDGNIIRIYEREYDEMGRETKFVHYNGDGTVNSSDEYEYDENGNEIKSVHYDGEGNIRWMAESEYDEKGREIYYSRKSDGVVTYTQENEYGEDGSVIREVVTYYNSDTGQKWYEKICEYTYDEKENMTKYDYTNYMEGGTTSLIWEREYDEDGRETDFYFYDNGKSASYQSQTEYDENGLMINYKGYDKDGTVLVRRETEYDISGNVVKENYYDADGNLIQYYENEYDDFGSITRQTMYENGIVKSEKQTSYAYHYIGNIDAEAADYMDTDMASEKYNLKQREIFVRFLNGEEKVRYYRDEDDVKDGKIVEETITDLIDFDYIRQNKRTLEYTFLDMTGDGIEELVIFYSGEIGRLCVIQCSYGALKVIFDLDGGYDVYFVKYNGMTGICYDYSLETRGAERKYCYFLGGKGKKEIVLDIFHAESGESTFYSMNDNDSFESRDISAGEYYDIADKIVSANTIDWQRLEEPDK